MSETILMLFFDLGLLVYFLYGIKHSKESNTTNTYSMLITSTEANKEPWGSMSPRDDSTEPKMPNENAEVEESGIGESKNLKEKSTK